MLTNYTKLGDNWIKNVTSNVWELIFASGSLFTERNIPADEQVQVTGGEGES